MRKTTVRLAALALVGITAAAAIACEGRRSAGKYSQRLVILGFDGMDPDLVNKWMAEGKLPNMQRLAAEGGVYPLATTH